MRGFFHITVPSSSVSIASSIRVIVKDTTSPDIITRVLSRAAAGGPDEALLREATEIIDTLRTLVDIRQEIELDASDPEGHA